MSIPKYDELQVPLLKLLSGNETYKKSELETPLAESFNLTAEEISDEYESGNGKIFSDRISWALSYLFMSKLIERPKRGFYKISPLGLKKLNAPEQIASYIQKIVREKSSGKQAGNNQSTESVDQDKSEELTPLEELYRSAEQIRNKTKEEILDTILSKTPQEFEGLVVKLLQEMGYGGEIKASGIVTSYSNDRGIDGIIKEDVLGLGKIHIQAKRYAKDNSIGRDEIQKFIGALAVVQSNKGVFITTSYFTKGALEYKENLNSTTNLVLIDGEMLANYFYDYSLGMQVEQTIKIKKLDRDFWDLLNDE